ncbi:hypothetical protein L198_07994 [Cryptococcus wingfieldii CBS 7118]|uniref:Fungal-type protein kinase domain-containing protein n=1 Tax=Cryptococcus wingfieldii CBS 7118 TaxID=1295528 RepID=A0A1E3HPK2_9TREE|nr:hypothetical protein L198_07994 [Cryptococcus wingfieldii CBS 7118]ODN78075.1 hypothetical protein L198_07994 [Cryptococcus wingfieldii CBS 7118]
MTKLFSRGPWTLWRQPFFTARERIADGIDIPSAHSPIFDLESFFWALVYVPLHSDTQGGTSNTRDASIFRSLFGSFPASESKRSAFLWSNGASENIYNAQCCLSPLKDLLRRLLDFLRDYHQQSLEAMNGKEGEIRKAGFIGNSRTIRKGGKGGEGTEGREVGKVEMVENAGEVEMMCPWTEGEENMAVDEFIEILGNYVREQVEGGRE